MNAVKSAWQYGMWLVVGSAVGMYVAMAGCAVEPSTSPSDESSIDQAIAGATPAPNGSLEPVPQCVCAIAIADFALGKDVDPDCVILCTNCGNGLCESGETQTNCPSDCGSSGPICGNGLCESGETQTSCPFDCGSPGPICGNGVCESGETSSSCPKDCGSSCLIFPCP